MVGGAVIGFYSEQINKTEQIAHTGGSSRSQSQRIEDSTPYSWTRTQVCRLAGARSGPKAVTERNFPLPTSNNLAAETRARAGHR